MKDKQINISNSWNIRVVQIFSEFSPEFVHSKKKKKIPVLFSIFLQMLINNEMRNKK